MNESDLNETENPQADVSGQCQKCGSSLGKPYTFHYLKKTGASKKLTYSDFKDGGVETIALCDKCVANHRNKLLLQFGFYFFFALIGGLFSFVYLIYIGAFSFYVGLGDLVVLFIVIGCGWMWLKIAREGLKGSGELFAVDIKEKWLIKQGYDTFLFDSEYAKLKSSS